ncbi:unnamed protein product, partial [Prorocentrum cordatum]
PEARSRRTPTRRRACPRTGGGGCCCGSLLGERIPPDLGFLGASFYALLAAISVHEALPSVAERALYDLLAALLLRAVYRADVQRGVLTSDEIASARLDRLVQDPGTAQRFGVSAAEVETLDAILRPLA